MCQPAELNRQRARILRDRPHVVHKSVATLPTALCRIADCNRKPHIILGMTAVGSPCKGREGIAVTHSPCEMPAVSELVVFSDVHELRTADPLQHSS